MQPSPVFSELGLPIHGSGQKYCCCASPQKTNKTSSSPQWCEPSSDFSRWLTRIVVELGSRNSTQASSPLNPPRTVSSTSFRSREVGREKSTAILRPSSRH